MSAGAASERIKVEAEPLIAVSPNEAVGFAPETVAPPMQTLLIAKHPEVMLYPTFEVEVAEPEILSPESVVVAKPIFDTESAEVEAAVIS